jgi:uncharacterized protein YjdB
MRQIKLVHLILTLLLVSVGFTSCGSDDVSVSGISLNKTSLTLLKGKTDSLVVTFTPDDASNKVVTWSSSDDNIVKVTQSGKITAVAAGTATITATSVDGQFKVNCVVTVKVNVSGLILSSSSLTLERGTTQTLSCQIEPEDATEKTIVWSSSDESVAKVDQDGNITALKGGCSDIIAATSDGTITAKCAVRVIVSVSGVSLDKASVNLIKGEEATLTCTVTPEDATSKDVTWSTSNSNIATVEEGEIKGVNVGTATITVTTKDGQHTASCQVTVTQDDHIGYNPYDDGQNW